MNRSFIQDYEYGLQNEIEVLSQLNQHFQNQNIKNTKDIYNNKFYKYDFEGDNIILEMKSRRNNKNKYPTTLIPLHKVIKTEKDFYFIIKFTDVCCWIKYDYKLFETFNKKSIQVIRKDKYENSIVNFEIPIKLLIDF
jgi:hypothetical protein